MIMVIVKTRDGIRSGFRRMKLVLRFPANALLQMANAITTMVTITPVPSNINRLSNAAPIELPPLG